MGEQGMGPRGGTALRWRCAAAIAVVVAGVLGVTGCGDDSSPRPAGKSASDSPERQAGQLPGFKRAYSAGYEEGRTLHDEGGKGAAVREIVHGGCAHRALSADDRADGDRGAWAKGCRDAVSGEPKDPPTHPVSQRKANPALLKDFRAWARAEGDDSLGRHADQLFTVGLTGPDFDVEVRTGCTSRSQAKKFASAFVDWWDGDDGRGVARSVVVLDPHNRRLAVQPL
ncbi:hypothetical protein [Streptomyces spectabilis]|uniref:Lipoprotein n=1 Tax=Streptomyces spectabilis TaxID=68270 RepID=A0A516RJU5_STRST|nr:hypothetical protein [Streptomyces spectabilis]QDQ15937.1 hypothetical protein FH965_39765 [Streptomyces spectabilis]